MTTADDTFAVFLDALAGTLDLGSEERARRLHLLERAAYRLVTGAKPVVEVALEAGFGSHEAFTRVFVRA